jgi:hypothetical protein
MTHRRISWNHAHTAQLAPTTSPIEMDSHDALLDDNQVHILEDD